MTAGCCVTRRPTEIIDRHISRFLRESHQFSRKYLRPIPSGAALRIYERGFTYLFYFQPNAAEYVGNTPIEMIEKLVAPGDLPKTVALAYADDFFANSIATGLLGEKVEIPGSDKVIDLAPGSLVNAGIEVVFVKQWPEEGFADWITLASSIKASGAEYLMGLTASPDETIQLVRAIKTVNYRPKGIYMSQGTQEEFKEALGDLVNGVTIHASWHPLVRWDGLLAGEKFTMTQWQRGKLEFVYPLGHFPGTKDLIYPKPEW